MNDPKASESHLCPHECIWIIGWTGMLPFEQGFNFGSDPIEFANPTSKYLCLLLGCLNTVLKPFDLSSPIIHIHSTIVFKNMMVELYSQTKLKRAHRHGGIHTLIPQKSNPKLIGVGPRHQYFWAFFVPTSCLFPIWYGSWCPAFSSIKWLPFLLEVTKFSNFSN